MDTRNYAIVDACDIRIGFKILDGNKAHRVIGLNVEEPQPNKINVTCADGKRFTFSPHSAVEVITK